MGASAEWTRARKGRHLGGFSEQEDIGSPAMGQGRTLTDDGSAFQYKETIWRVGLTRNFLGREQSMR